MRVICIHFIELPILGRGIRSRFTFFVGGGGGELGDGGIDVWEIQIDTCLGSDSVSKESECYGNTWAKGELHG